VNRVGEERYRIWAEVSGGVTGSRAGWLKASGKIKEFPSREAAEREAAHLSDTMKSPTARFRYTVERANPTMAKKPADRGAAKTKALYGAAKSLAKYGLGPVGWTMLNKGKRKKRNPGSTAEEAYEAFHGRAPEGLIEFYTRHKRPGKTSAIGELVSLSVRIPKERVSGSASERTVDLSDFGEAWLTENPKMNQLYIEGGDQSVDLSTFGLSDSDPHEFEYLGDLVKCVYYTTKDHLGAEGGDADYRHTFGKKERLLGLGTAKTELIRVGYHVPDEQLVLFGGGYEILPEGIDG